MTKHSMKTRLQANCSFDCKCGVCSGSIPGQDGIISEIIQLVPEVTKEHDEEHDEETIKALYKMKKEDWKTEASNLEKAADLMKQLYIGDIQNKFYILILFVSASQMARDPTRLKKALGILKEEIDVAGLKEECRGKCYNSLEEDLQTWSREFKSKRAPGKEEINYFYL